MVATTLADSALLVLASLGLGVAALRIASGLAPAGLPRVIAAVALAAAGAVAEALGLGLAGLGGSPVALTLAAVLTAAVTVVLTPRPGVGLLSEAATSWAAASWPARLGLGAAGGGLAAVLLIQLHRPVLGQDAVTYHLPEVIGFVQSGHTGAVQSLFYGLPVGNYPITEEVLLAWATGIAHGFAPALVLTVANVGLLLGAGWLTLAELEVPAGLRVLALAALALVPLITQAWVQPGTDLEATAWMVCTVALALAARRHPGLLAAAVVCAGLALGTKTTVLTYSVGILLVAAVRQRRELARSWRPLVAAVLLALATGAIWYLRNWVQHGSPLWPFSSFPGGAPEPAIIAYLHTPLLASLGPTLFDHLGAYVAALSGSVPLILAGFLAALGLLAGLRRLHLPRRYVRIGAAGLIVILGALEYALGPVTGLPRHGGVLVAVVGSTLRYLFPVIAAGTLALALAAADPRPPIAWLARLVLAGALVWDLSSDLPAHFSLAFDGWLWPGLGTGLLLSVVLGARARARVRGRSSSARLARPDADSQPAPGPAPRPVPVVFSLLTGVALAALFTVGLTVGSRHFSLRHAAVSTDFATAVSAFLDTQPAYTATDAPVATTKTGLAPLAGDRLQHRLSLIPVDASCARVAAIGRRHWIVLAITPPAARSGILARIAPYGSAEACLARRPPAFDDGQYAVYAPWQTLANLS
ncbi:hypothetical protein [Conexibacter sp. DBS9H8]|uniref:hypothetical protein n=1 Tax=Conexibacter sp. DBS9H8 TaxID=2937801 RepID=UPI0020103ED5|nr:hypothetical protein [Conexibacter sp. DBS9H8]